MLVIDNLHAQIEGKNILNGIQLTVKPGEVHAIMGPNGSGKSTLANVLAGHEKYTVTQGTVTLQNQSLLSLSVEERAALGIFLAFQYPIEFTGVTNIHFLKTAFNALRKAQNKTPCDAIDFLSLVREKLDIVQMDESFLYRPVNCGFSGGEKKRNEILQMALLEPRLAILDETDSGLDIDALKTVAEGVNHCKHADRAIIVVTHYQRLLNYITPDYVHILAKGKIIRSGSKALALELEEKGYADLCA